MKRKKEKLKFGSCVICKKDFVLIDQKTGSSIPFKSEFPVCAHCYVKGLTEAKEKNNLVKV